MDVQLSVSFFLHILSMKNVAAILFLYWYATYFRRGTWSDVSVQHFLG